MPTRDSYHVVAIDFSPHTEAMQTDALLETGMQYGVGVNAFCDSSPKRMIWLVLAVAAFVIVIMTLSNL